MAEMRLEWDDWNVAHVRRHGVTPTDVEEACRNAAVTLQSYKGRKILIGETRSGRLLAVVVMQIAEGAAYYPVTARPASNKERRYYRALKGGES